MYIFSDLSLNFFYLHFLQYQKWSGDDDDCIDDIIVILFFHKPCRSFCIVCHHKDKIRFRSGICSLLSASYIFLPYHSCTFMHNAGKNWCKYEYRNSDKTDLQLAFARLTVKCLLTHRQFKHKAAILKNSVTPYFYKHCQFETLNFLFKVLYYLDGYFRSWICGIKFEDKFSTNCVNFKSRYGACKLFQCFWWWRW